MKSTETCIKILDPEIATRSGLALQISAFYYERRIKRYKHLNGVKVLTRLTVITKYHHPELDAVIYALRLSGKFGKE